MLMLIMHGCDSSIQSWKHRMRMQIHRLLSCKRCLQSAMVPWKHCML